MKLLLNKKYDYNISYDDLICCLLLKLNEYKKNSVKKTLIVNNENKTKIIN